MSAIVQDSMKEFANEHRAGFFGSWVLASFMALRDAGVSIQMTVLSREPDKFLDENPLFRKLDGLTFLSGDVVTAEVPRGTTHVFHFATSPTDRAGDEAAMRRTIVDGTQRMLLESIRVGAKRFLLASSGAVYGQGKTDRPREDELILPRPLDPSVKLTTYGHAKREAEGFCTEAMRARSIECVTVRGFAFGGPLFPIDGPYALSAMMKAMIEGTSIEVKSPSTVRSYLDGRDLVRALWLLLLRGRSGESYNLGSDDSVTMQGLAKEIQALAKDLGRPVPEIVEVTPSPSEHQSGVLGAPVSGPGDIYRPTIEKISRHLGWKPQVSLRAGLRAYAEWLLPPPSV